MPTVKETEQILDIISSDPKGPKSIAAQKKLGLSDTAIEAWTVARQAPDDPRSAKVKNKIFDQISQNMPAKQEVGGVGFVDRAVVKNLIDRDPVLQQKYLEKKGYITRQGPGGLEARTPDELQFRPVDPEGFDRFDVFDVFGDAMEAVVTGFATGAKVLGLVGAPATGGTSLAATSALGAASTAGFELGKQKLAQAVGAREELDVGRITQAGIIGGTIPGLAKVGGKVIREVGKALNKGAQKVFPYKPNAKEIDEAARLLGFKPTPGQLSASKAVQRAEAELAQSPFVLPGTGRGVQKSVERVQKIVEDQSEGLVENYATQRNLELGESAIKKISQAVKEKLKPAEEIYERLEKVYNFIDEKDLVDINLTPVRERIAQLADNTFDDATETALKKAANKVERVTNLKQLSDLRSSLLKATRNSINPDFKSNLSELANTLRVVRSDTLKKQFPDAVESINQADSIWRQTAQEVQDVFFKPGSPFKGSVKGAVEKKLASVPGAEAVQKLLKKSDFRQLEKFKANFPEAFEELRGGAVDDLISRSMTQDGKVSVGNLVKSLRKLPLESQNLIFGENKKKIIDALETVMQETQATIRNNPSRLRDILVQVTSFEGIKSATLGQLRKFFLARVVGAPETARAITKGIEKAGEKIASPAGVAGAEFGVRQFMPPPENKLTFGIPNQ